MFGLNGRKVLEHGDPPTVLGRRSVGDPFPQYWHKAAPLGLPGVGLSLVCPVVINEAGNACNPVLRVEGDTDQNLLYVNGVTNRLGIGTSTPRNVLDVVGTNGVRMESLGLAPNGTLATYPNGRTLDVLGATNIEGLVFLDVPDTTSIAYDLQVNGFGHVRLDTFGGYPYTYHLGRETPGSPGIRWFYIEFGLDTRILSHILPNGNGSPTPDWDLGNASPNQWRDIYCQRVLADNLVLGYVETAIDYVMQQGDHFVIVTNISGGPRIINLPLAATFAAGTPVTIQDGSGNILIDQPGSQIVCQRQGADTIGGYGSTIRNINERDMAIEFVSNGVDTWYSR